MPTLSPADPVLETQVFWDRYKKEVLIVVLLALLAGAAWGGYRIYTARRDATAASALTPAKTAAEFQKIIAQYPATPAGASAHLLLAEEQRKEKKFVEANATLQAFVDKYPTHQLKGTARMAIGANLTSLGKGDEALAAYQRLAADDSQGFIAPIALLAQVHILKEKNQVEEARRVCETILTKYRESLVANEATRQLRLLRGGEEPAKPVTPPITTTGGTPGPVTSAAPAAPPAAVPAAPPAAVPPVGNTPKATVPPK